MPGIAGSQAYDVILSLEEYGIPKPDTQTTADGFSWSSDITDIEGIQFQYDISANEDHEIAAASFIVLGKDNIGILAFCASLPYTAADSDAATAFVNEHLDGEATITIGDAIFTIYQTKVGPRLDITVVGYDDYVWSKAGG